MSDLIITGWKPGLQTISLIRLVRANSRMSLKEAKQAVEELMDGKEIRLSGLSEERLVAFRQAAEALNAICGSPESVSLQETKPAPTSEEMTAKRLRVMLSNARNLIKAKVYPPARKNLQEVIDEARGTPEAGEAKSLLDSIPK